jgi:hypothetical protein
MRDKCLIALVCIGALVLYAQVPDESVRPDFISTVTNIVVPVGVYDRDDNRCQRPAGTQFSPF